MQWLAVCYSYVLGVMTIAWNAVLELQILMLDLKVLDLAVASIENAGLVFEFTASSGNA